MNFCVSGGRLEMVDTDATELSLVRMPADGASVAAAGDAGA